MLNKRVQILFDKDLWNKTVKFAKGQHISLGELIRKSVREHLDQQKQIKSKEPKTPFNRFFKSNR